MKVFSQLHTIVESDCKTCEDKDCEMQLAQQCLCRSDLSLKTVQKLRLQTRNSRPVRQVSGLF